MRSPRGFKEIQDPRVLNLIKYGSVCLIVLGVLLFFVGRPVIESIGHHHAEVAPAKVIDHPRVRHHRAQKATNGKIRVTTPSKGTGPQNGSQSFKPPTDDHQSASPTPSSPPTPSPVPQSPPGPRGEPGPQGPEGQQDKTAPQVPVPVTPTPVVEVPPVLPPVTETVNGVTESIGKTVDGVTEQVPVPKLGE